MIGSLVSAPVGHGSEVEGTVIEYDQNSGALTIKDDDGELFNGYEYQVTIILDHLFAHKINK